MNMSNVVLRERRTRKQKTPVISASVKLAHGCWFNLRFRRALRIASIILLIAFLGFLSSAAFGANPAQEMAIQSPESILPSIPYIVQGS